MQKIKEGSASISISPYVFYNPRMTELRDLSVSFLKALDIKSARLLDSTAATGVRGIRYSIEAGIKDIVFLDINKKAYLNLRGNIKLNGLKLVSINKSIQEFSNSTAKKFDVIDIDPFGSPQPYIYDIMKVSTDNTILMITATDTAVLCGAQPHACNKIYGSKPLHNELCKEVGTRILLSYISKVASQFNFGIEPLLAVSSQHYMRVFIRLRRGSANAIGSLKSNGFGSCCARCHGFYLANGIVPILSRKCSNCKGVLEQFGPLWLGKLYDKKITRTMQATSREFGSAAAKLIKTINNELDTPMFYSIPKITKTKRIGSISHYKVIERLSARGFAATATQFGENAIKTNAGIRDVTRALKQ